MITDCRCQLPSCPFTMGLQGTRLEPAQRQGRVWPMRQLLATSIRVHCYDIKTGPLACPAWGGTSSLTLTAQPNLIPPPNNIASHLIVFGVTSILNHASGSRSGHLQYPPIIPVILTHAAQISSIQVPESRPALGPCAAPKLSAATATSNENPVPTQHETTERRRSSRLLSTFCC